MIIQKLKEELEVLESIEFKELNKQQKQMLKDNYNFYVSKLQYGMDDWGNVIFICSNDTLKNMEYYLGFEYEKEYIELKLTDMKKVIVSYSGSERVENIFNKLQELEENAA